MPCGVFEPDKGLELPTLPNQRISTILKDRKLIVDNRRSKYSLRDNKYLDKRPPTVRSTRNFSKSFHISPEDIGIPNHFQNCGHCGKSRDMPVFDINIGICPQLRIFNSSNLSKGTGSEPQYRLVILKHDCMGSTRHYKPPAIVHLPTMFGYIVPKILLKRGIVCNRK